MKRDHISMEKNIKTLEKLCIKHKCGFMLGYSQNFHFYGQVYKTSLKIPPEYIGEPSFCKSFVGSFEEVLPKMIKAIKDKYE